MNLRDVDINNSKDIDEWIEEHITKCRAIGSSSSIKEAKDDLINLFDQIKYLDSLFD